MTDEIALSNDENGVAVFLEKWLKEQIVGRNKFRLGSFERIEPTAVVISYPRIVTDISYENAYIKGNQNSNEDVIWNKMIVRLWWEIGRKIKKRKEKRFAFSFDF